MWAIAKTRTKHAKHASRRGFTVVELLIVIVVVGILAAITLVAYNGVQNNARTATLQSDLNGASKTLEIAKVADGVYPVNSAAADLLKKSPGTIFNYSASTKQTSYCLTATNGGIGISYRITNTNTAPVSGICSGVMADGTSCPTGYIVAPGSSTYNTSDFCVMKYIASNSGGVATSQPGATPWVNISQTNALSTANAACSGCHLITEPEWLTIAQNVLNVASNWSGGSVGSGFIYSGHNDNAPANALTASTNDSDGYNGTGNSTSGGANQRRTLTLTNGEVIWDLAGNVWNWTAGTSTTGQPGSSGLAWREWNALANSGSLATNPMPSFGTPAASGWTSAQGIGQIYSNSNEADLRGFLRGGSWSGGGLAGVFALLLHPSPGSGYGTIGFRVAR